MDYILHMNARTVLVARYVFAAAAMVLLVAFVDVRELGDALDRTNGWLAVGGIAFGYATWLLNTRKWQMLLAGRGVRVGLGRLFRLNLVSALYGTILPGQVAGEAVKLFRLAREPRDRGILVSSVVVDRITGLIGLIVVGLVGAMASDSEPLAATLVLATGLAVCIGVGTWLLRPRLDWTMRSGSGFVARMRSAGGRLLVALGEFREVPATLGGAIAMSVAFQAMVTVNIVIFAEALSMDVSIVDLAWIVSIVSVVQLLPITVASIGTRDAAFIVLLGVVDVPKADAVALSVLMLAGNLAVALGGGLSELVPERQVALPDEAPV